MFESAFSNDISHN